MNFTLGNFYEKQYPPNMKIKYETMPTSFTPNQEKASVPASQQALRDELETVNEMIVRSNISHNISSYD